MEKTALISGAASGIGFATAKLFAKEGADIVIADLNDTKKDDVVASVKSQRNGTEAIFFKLDATKEDSWIKAFEETINVFGKVDIVCNIAGIGVFKNVEETSFDDWQKVIGIINLTGVFLGTKHGIINMKKNKSGSIINMSSIEGFIGDPNLAAYCASRGGAYASLLNHPPCML
ncbi:SDR family NAD(P)-dependent oxidoreductase [Terrilactibacillus sp. S3-3]|nr:SDR family NAD(P)-dependent oxidoreductase [Terrilactibacillus sp. S3-3]